MAARNVNLVLEQGVDFQATFTIRNTNNAPLNLTGYTGISSIRKHPTSSTATDSIEGGRYVYDVILVSPNSYRSRAVQGNVLVTPGVS